MAMPEKFHSRMSPDEERRKVRTAKRTLNRFKNYIKGKYSRKDKDVDIRGKISLAEEVVSKLFTYGMKKGVKTLSINCHEKPPASMEFLLASRGGNKEKKGEVVILKSSEEELNLGENVAKNIGITNASFMKGSVDEYSGRKTRGKFSQIFMSNPFLEDGWEKRLKKVVKKNLKRGGSLFVVDSELSKNPKCGKIVDKATNALIKKTKVNGKRKIGWFGMEEVSVKGVESPVVVFCITKSKNK
jgi:hypothetical protein